MTTITNDVSPTSNPNAALRRLRIVLAAALLPFMFAILLSGLFYLIGDYKIIELVPAKTEFASITSPTRTKAVGYSFVAEGTIDQLPADTTAYLMTKRDGRYWPKKKLGQASGSWSHTITDAKQKRSKLYLVILALEEADKISVQQWYDKTQQTGRYPGITSFTTAREIAVLEVRQQ